MQVLPSMTLMMEDKGGNSLRSWKRKAGETEERLGWEWAKLMEIAI